MNIQDGSSATVVFTVLGEPDSATWRVEDENGAILVAEAPVPGAAMDGTSVTLEVPGEFNTLAENQHRGLRLVLLRYRAEDLFTGSQDLEITYDVIGSEGELVIQTNSFVVYNEAIMLSREVTEAEGFNAASRQSRVEALAEAWRLLSKLHYTIPMDYDRSMTRVTDFPGSDPDDLTDMTAEEFLSLDPGFIAAIKRAQVVEAVERLGGRSVNDARAKGLLSSTIGEVSQMYRSGRPMDIGLSRRALWELRGYISYSMKLGRA
jgi:hypothetical protein